MNVGRTYMGTAVVVVLLLCLSSTYASVSISSVFPPELPTQGGSITITGYGWGSSVASVYMLDKFAKQIYCGDVIVISSTQLSCLFPPGIGSGLLYIINSNGEVNLAGHNFGYEAPTLTSNSYPSLVSVGTRITICGSNWGPTVDNIEIISNSGFDLDLALTTPHQCLAFNAWENVIAGHSSDTVYFNIVLKNDPNLGWGGASMVSFSVNIAAPSIDSVSPNQVDGVGYTLIQIQGYFLGTVLSQISIVFEVGQTIYNAYDVTLVTPDQVISCRIPMLPLNWDESSAFARIIIYNHGNPSFNTYYLEYNHYVTIQSVSPNTVPTSGGFITVIGSGFDIPCDLPLTVFILDPDLNTISLCESVKILSYFELTCFVPNGVGNTDGVLKVSVNGKEASFYPFGYAAPMIFAIFPQIVQQGTQITVYGQNFGSSTSTLTAYTNDGPKTPCIVGYVSDTHFVCTANSEHPGGPLGFGVKVASSWNPNFAGTLSVNSVLFFTLSTKYIAWWGAPTVHWEEVSSNSALGPNMPVNTNTLGDPSGQTNTFFAIWTVNGFLNAAILNQGSTFNPASTPDTQINTGNHIIAGAIYGATGYLNGGIVDVTYTIRKTYDAAPNNAWFTVPVTTNNLVIGGADPAYGITKKLVVFYSSGEAAYQNEGYSISLWKSVPVQV